MPKGMGYPGNNPQNEPKKPKGKANLEKGFISKPMYAEPEFDWMRPYTPLERTTVRRRNNRKEYEDET